MSSVAPGAIRDMSVTPRAHRENCRTYAMTIPGCDIPRLSVARHSGNPRPW